MTRGFNFGAGPAMLPEALLLEAQRELPEWQDSGMSILEVSHRSQKFLQLMDEAEQSLRLLLQIPDNYHILFLGLPARSQFSMVPLNFLAETARAAYLVTGHWSSMALDEAGKFGQAYCIATGAQDNFTAVPHSSSWQIQNDTAYIYYTPNETINGVRCTEPPRFADIPLVADMTSCLLTEPLQINDYGLIFAGAQKNIANAGLTVVIIRDDLLHLINKNNIPTIMDYRTQVKYKSLYATPPTFNCYLALKMFQWIAKQGGVSALYEINCKKAALLYNYIDSSSFYHCKIQPEARSLVNICFSLEDEGLEDLFVKEAAKDGLLALKGHKAIGGLRASLYNSMPLAGVEKLIAFMQKFAKEQAL